MKSLTIKYWNTLEKSYKERTLSMVYGNQHGIINMLLSEKSNKKCPFWKIVFSKVKITDDGHYKTTVNGTYPYYTFYKQANLMLRVIITSF